jgi:hypothetical protein
VFVWVAINRSTLVLIVEYPFPLGRSRGSGHWVRSVDEVLCDDQALMKEREAVSFLFFLFKRYDRLKSIGANQMTWMMIIE